MNNVFVYCEMEGAHVADVSLELLTKGRKLATQLGCQLETICAGTDLADVEKQVLPYGVDRVHVFDAPGLFPYTSLPHTSILVNLFKMCLMLRACSLILHFLILQFLSTCSRKKNRRFV